MENELILVWFFNNWTPLHPTTNKRPKKAAQQTNDGKRRCKQTKNKNKKSLQQKMTNGQQRFNLLYFEFS